MVDIELAFRDIQETNGTEVMGGVKRVKKVF